MIVNVVLNCMFILEMFESTNRKVRYVYMIYGII